ncbi:alpha-glucosidase [Sphingomonas sp.]|uniref:alpha-glucosidase n=1 Tax=Sphingomonas sp. TaxID=28214 RepID=UPI00386E889B
MLDARDGFCQAVSYDKWERLRVICASGSDGTLRLSLGGHTLLDHRPGCPALTLAKGAASVTMMRGNFAMSDTPFDALSPGWCRSVAANHWEFASSRQGPAVAELTVTDDDGADRIHLRALDPAYDRLTLRLHAEPGEAVWGGGEQMSYLMLNGRRFPMWTSEPGVGRDKTTALTRQLDELAMAGGDYWTTNYPQPTFLTSRGLAIHLESTAYSVLDFSDSAAHVVELWEGRASLAIFTAATLPALVTRLSDHFGRPAPLPDWVLEGAIVGLKDGAASFDRLDTILAAGAAVGGLWCEDWCGVRETSFGRRLFWDWKWHPARYPALPARIAALRDRGIRFLAYANPYLAVDGSLYEEALAAGHLALRLDSDAPYHVDFGEFDAAVVDFTSPGACDWFADRILGRELLDLDIAGWMADFGEYLPTDVRLADGSDAMLAHNRWPLLWAQVNARAIAARGKADEAIFFMRAGFSGVQGHCPLLWAGDQSVDFTRHDGIGTVITAAISAGLIGNAVSHSDVGGYTSILGNIRSEELLLRWIELGAFTPVMRSHEGNRPDDNLQIDSNPRLLAHFARFSRLHAALAPYVRSLRDEAAATGLPLQRPLFLLDPDPALFAIEDQYAYGPDMIVAPVIEEHATGRSVVLTSGEWRHLWTGDTYPAGTHIVPTPIGQPPVFTRIGSAFAALFESLTA